MEARERIILVTERMPPTFGGAAIRVYRYARRLETAGLLGGLIAFRPFARTHRESEVQKAQALLPPVSDQYLFKVPCCSSYSHKWIVRGSLRLINFMLLPFYIFPALFRFRKKAGIIHCFGVSPMAFFCIMAGRFLGMKTILELVLLGTDDPRAVQLSNRSWLKNAYRRCIFKHVDHLVPISKALMNQCLDSGIDKRRITVVANPVDISLFSPVTEKKAKEYRRETGIPEQWKPLICLIGAVTLRKGVDLLFEFFRLFQMKYPDAGLVIVGPSDNTAEEKQLTEKLMQFARDHSFSDKVLFTGQISDVRPYLATSDFFVFTSRREGFANVVIESMAMGCPVIALKLPDITDTIIHHGRNGLIVDRADPELFVKAVENLMLDDDRREKMVAAALETVREKFSNEIIDRQYLDLYRRLQGIAVIETIQERN